MRLTPIALFLLSCSLMAAEPKTLPVWPGAVPGDENYNPPEPKAKNKNDGVMRIALVTKPELAFYPAPNDTSDGTMVIVCPGGGYNILAYDKEGTEIAQWLNSIGISAAVLSYRVPRRPNIPPHQAPLQDAQRAIRLARQHASEWKINPKKIGILGFSAGGHLTVMTGVAFDKPTYPHQDAADDLSCRPDFLVPIYPAYLGNEKTAGPLSEEITVSKDTPPTFMAVTHDDALRGVNAASLYIELKKNNVPAELHIYTKGGHGYGMRPSANPVHTWPVRLQEWFVSQGILPASK